MGGGRRSKALFPISCLSCRRRHGGGKAVLFSKFVFISKHAVPTVDIAPAERLWCVLDKPFTHLWFMCLRCIKPGFWQTVGGGVDPGWARHTVTLTEPFY